MTARLHSIVVVPAAMVVLATAAPGSNARACKPVILPPAWAADCVRAGDDRAGGDRPRAAAADPAASLPVAGPGPADAVTAPGGRQATPAASAGDEATGGAVAASARGPPARPA